MHRLWTDQLRRAEALGCCQSPAAQMGMKTCSSSRETITAGVAPIKEMQVMETVPVYLGLDYHTTSVQACVLDASGRVLVNRRLANDPCAVAGVVKPGWVVKAAAVESCCGAADFAEALMGVTGWAVALAHSGYVARMKANPDKTDYADARVLAELSRAGLIPRVWLPPRPIAELRLLVRLRADLVGSARACKTRVLAVLRQQRITAPPEAKGRWTKAWLAWLKGAPLSEQGRFVVGVLLEELAAIAGRVQQVEAQLQAATAGDAVVEKLLSIKGVGRVTAWTMRATIGRFDRFASGKALARFCAVTPCNASSGNKLADSGMVRAGDKALKGVVIEAAQRLARYEPRWRELCQSLRARGKPASVAVGAVANRWVRWLYHQMKEEAAITPAAAA